MKKTSGRILFSVLILAGIIVFTVSPEKRPLTEGIRQASGSDFIQLSDGFCEYQLTGPADGTPVVLVHGLSVPYFDWDGQYQVLGEAGYRVLRYNHYGRGLSDRPRTEYNSQLYVRQLKDLIDSQGWEKVDLVVHSMGGAVAVKFTETYPDAVDRIVFISPVLHMAEDNSGITLVRIPVLGDLMAGTALSGILSSRADDLFSSSGIEEAGLYSQMFREQTRYYGFSRSVKSLFRNNMVDDLSDSYRTVHPGSSFLIWGTEDQSVSEEHIQRIRNILPGMETVILKDTGHMPNMEKRELVNSLILDFLKS
ncbi:MAG: alpha/beta hydrolase [Spirochaetales bacterium]|nr:alpha/beta hydrolase [Spirochaetales bacterium]